MDWKVVQVWRNTHYCLAQIPDKNYKCLHICVASVVWATATGPRTNNSKYMIWWKSEVGMLKGNVPRIVENPLMLLATATFKVRGLPQLVCSGAVATVPCPRCVHGNQWIHPVKSCRLASMWLWQDMLAVFLKFSEFLWGTKSTGLEEQLTHSVMKDVQLLQTKSVQFYDVKAKTGKRSKCRMKGNC